MRFHPRKLPVARVLAAVMAAGAMAGCSTTGLPDAPTTVGQTARPHYKVGAPYQIDGIWYVPKVDETYEEIGIASWYGDAFHGKLTANGEIFDKGRISAAHKTLPMPVLAEVENLENGRRIVVRVNDRGPFVGDRVIDLSHAAADELGFTAKGLARVRVRYVGETELMALAAKPGETNRARLAAATPATSPIKTHASKIAVEAGQVAKPQSGDAGDDALGALIASASGPLNNPANNPANNPVNNAAQPAQPTMMANAMLATPIREFWVEIARIGDISELGRLRLAADLGPVSLRSAPDGSDGLSAGGQSVVIGPYTDEPGARAFLTRAQAAGYGAARIVPGAGGK